MGRTLKLKNNDYWDPTSIMNNISRVTFNLQPGSSVTLNCDGAKLVMLFSGKASLGAGIELTLLYTYDSGTPSRTNYKKIVSGDHLSYTIDGQKIIITNNAPTGNRYDCSLLFLVGNPTNVLIS